MINHTQTGINRVKSYQNRYKMTNKQTAVEWLMSRFESGDMYNVEDAQFIKHQALKMEKEQLIDAYTEGYDIRDNMGSLLTNPTGEQYYNEIYGK